MVDSDDPDFHVAGEPAGARIGRREAARPAVPYGLVSRLAAARLAGAAILLGLALPVHATEGALGRQVTGAVVQPNAGIVSPEPMTAVNLSSIYLDGSISGSRSVPVGRNVTLGLNADVAFGLATVLHTWDTGPGRWNFASALTVPYLWTVARAKVTGPLGNSSESSDRTSNLFDLYFSPIIAGYHFSQTQHASFSLNVWAPTGNYNASALANPSLHNWTLIPQAAYTGIFPEDHLQFDSVASLQFYSPNDVTHYHNAPIFGLDLMGRRMFGNGVGVGLVLGTLQQLSKDSGPTAQQLNGFEGRDWAFGPIVTYDRKLAHDRTLSLSARWVPTVSSTNRLDSTSTFMVSATLVF